MIIDVRPQGNDDSPVESLHFAVRLGFVRRCKIIVIVQDPVNMEDYFWCDMFSIVKDEVRRWAVVEDPVIDEMFCSFSSGDVSHRHSFRQCLTVSDNQ